MQSGKAKRTSLPKRIFFIATIGIFLIFSAGAALAQSYSYQRTITIDHTKVPNTDLTSFPVLISGVYSYLATTGNGGKVQNSNGYDIIFTTDAAGTNKLDHEIESYDPTTGTINFWVRIPTLSHTAATVIYLQYGNSGITSSQENKTGVWDGDFQGVWHLNGTPLSAADSTSNGNNGTINGAAATTGKMAGAGNFSGSSQDIQIGNLGARPTKGTISMWVQAPSLSSFPNAFATGFGCDNTAIRIELNSSGDLSAPTGDSGCELGGPTFTTSFTANVWHYVTVTWDSSAELNTETAYFDGVSSQTVTNTFFPANFDSVTIGLGFGSGRYWIGQIDEVRMSSTLRSANWIAAEYSNQNSPSTFYSMGSENTVAVAVSPSAAVLYGGQTQQFTAAVTGNSNTAVTWTISPSGTGSISSAGLYTAPTTISTQQTVTVTATSSADSTKSASATITLDPPISVSVAPSTMTLVPSQTAQFTATLANTANSAVTWTISPAGTGAVNSAGVYTAPATISTTQTVTITATSVVDTTKSGSATVTLSPASSTFSYHRPITISHTKVPNTDQTDFPVLISGTYSYLATVANGGRVQNANGYDIIFTTDAAGSVKLNHEIETYNPATGAVNLWVQIPTLSHTTDTTIYMHYGSSAATASLANAPGVWDSNFAGVWHLANGTTLNSADSTSNQNNGTNNGATATTGEIDGAAAFNGSSQFIGIGPLGTFSFSTPLTLSAWVKPNSSSGVEKIIALTGSTVTTPDGPFNTFVANLNATNGKFVAETGKATATTDDAVAPTAFTTGQWSYVSGTFDTSKVTLYVNGVQQATTPYSSAGVLSVTNPNGWSIGEYVENGTAEQWWNGAVDEVRISTFVRPPDWMATEYNNQSSPSTFYSIGAEDTISVSLTPATSALYAGQTQPFSAATTNAANPGVTWSISPSTGTISSAGVYTAPSSISTQQTVTVTATSAQDNTTSASATVTLYPTAGVSVTPSAQTLYPGQTQQFSVTVSNAATQAVTWTITPAVGSISSSGLYTAPAVISSQQTVTITAASVAEPTQSGTATLTLGQWSQAYNSRRAITLSHALVANTDQSNFPVLISGTYSYLATVANGGEVQSGNGYDIIFTTDAAGSSKLDHEIDSYNPAIGAASFWVRIPTLSHTVDTVIYMQYGNSAITTSQENKTGVWDSNYQMVLHLGEAGSPYHDSTSNGFSSTGGTAPTQTTGKIGQGQSFNGSSQYIAYSQAQSPNPTGNVTLETWVKTTDTGSKGLFGKWVSDGCGDPDQSYQIYITGGTPHGLVNSTDTTDVDLGGASTVDDGNWHHIVLTAPAPTGTNHLYIDGVQSSSLTNSHLLLATTADRLLVGATSIACVSGYVNGSLDEVRISNSIRSSDWIATEYNNQNSPSTFYSTGAENAPLILSLSPASGEPGTSVTIHGLSFGSSTGTVTFNGTSATVTSWSGNSITAVVPNGASSGPVVVTSSSVSGNGVAFTVITPFISSLSPTYGSAGTSVTIAGTGFGSSAGTVTFNGVTASTTAWSDLSITATVPSGAGMGNVIVSNNGETSNGVMFGAPVITSLSPAAGAVGTSVTINGASFGSTTGSVTFDGLSATITSWSTGSITATVPSGALSGPVVVTVSGVSSNAVGFLVQQQTFTGTVNYSYDPLGRLVGVVAATGDAATYNYDAVGNILSITRTPSTQPTVLSFSPTSGPVGTQVTISGSNFSSTIANDTVKFNGTTATISSATSTQLVVTVPSGSTTGAIAVTSPAGTATSSGSFTVTNASSQPSISSFSSSIVTAGNTVTINGSGFDATPANDRLIVNTTVAAVPTSITSTSMVLTVPSVGSGRIYLSTPGGSTVSSDLFVTPSGNSPSGVSYTGRAAMNSTTTVSMSSAGAIGGYLLFDGVAGKSVTVTAASSSFTFCSFNIYKPDGTALLVSGVSCAASSAGSINGVVLPVNGTYNILVHPDSGLTGSVNITLSDATNAFTTLASGTPATLTTTVAGQGAQATFSATGGQQAALQLSSNTIGSVTASVLNPDGSTLTSMTSSASSFSFPTLLLPQTGVYTVLITPAGTNTGSIQVTATVSGGASGVPSRPVGDTLNTSSALATNLVGLFVMNEGSGTTDVNLVDSQTATFSGAAPPTWMADPSILFQGGTSLNSYLNAGADLNFDQLTTGQMTIVAKVLVTTAAASGIAEKNDGDVNSGFVFGIDNTGALRLTVEKDQGNMQAGSAAGAVLPNQWIQVAFTWDGTVGTSSAAHLYLNGVEQTKAIAVDGSGTIQYQNATAQPFRIGNAGFDYPGAFSGRIAYLAVYKGRILTTTELGQLDAQLPIH